MKRTIQVLMSVIMVSTMVLVACGANVKAIGGANEGSSPIGGGCSGGYDAIWWDTCFGYSWQAYRVTKDLPSSNYVTFHYTDNTGGPTYLHYCKKGQIIYNYGFEVYNGSFYENDGVAPIQSYGTQVSTQLDKDDTQARWRAGGALGAYDGVNNTTSNYLTAEGYATTDIVKKKYEEMVEYDAAHHTNYAHDTTWDTVGYFCWSDFTIKVNATEGQYDGGSFKPVYEGEKIKVIQSDIISSVTAGGKDVVLDVNNYSDPSGYTWVQWGTGGACKGQSKRCVIANAESGETLNAYYVRNKFEGQATVNGGGSSASTGFVGKEGDGYDWAETRTIKLSNCPTSGCEVNFSFDLKKTAGNGVTTYNLWRSTDRSSAGEQVTDSPKWSEGAIPSRTEKIKSGETVCWRMSFYAVAAVSKPSSDGAKIGRVKICAEAEGGEQPDGFSGKIEVFGPDGRMSSDDDRYTVIDRRREYTIDNCSSDGCIVRFGHYVLASGSGSGSTSYEVNRSSNLEEKVGKHRESGKTSGGRVYADTVTMYPGMRVCEELRFLPDPAQTSHYTVINACVVAAGTADSDISIEVKNEDGSEEYQSWKDDYVYAKPIDTVSFRGTYTPTYQSTYGLKVDSVRIMETVNGEDKILAEAEWNQSNEEKLGNIFDKGETDGWGWFNAFSIALYSGDDKRMDVVKAYKGASGSSESYNGELTHEVTQSDVGKSLNARAETNATDSKGNNETRTKTTPEKVVLKYSDGGNHLTADVYTNSKNDRVDVYVPYNFQTETEITSDFKNINVPAGGSIKVNFNYIVKPRFNNKTMKSGDKEYITGVAKANHRLEYCVGEGECNSGNYKPANEPKLENNYSIPIKNEDNMYDVKIVNLSEYVPVPSDVVAGTKICVRSSVFPRDSGGPGNYDKPIPYDFNDDSSWAKSSNVLGGTDEKCFQVGKRPNFQVWGGSVYSAGDLKLAQTTKNIGGESYVFGSWTELGLVANGTVEGLASGAGLGYNSTGDAESVSQVGFVEDDHIGGAVVSGEHFNYCNVSTLSFLNHQCGSSSVGSASVQSNISESDLGNSALIYRFVREIDVYQVSDNAKNKISEIDVSDGAWRIEDNNLIFEGVTVGEEKKMVLVFNGGDEIIIDKNIKYGGDGASYSSFKDMPKVVIYANNIEIGCGVTRIDAVLIANGTIDTCPTGEVAPKYTGNKKHNNPDNSNRLMINGSVIAKKLVLNRTYGAASGVNAVVPAEIINYDTSLYSWASNRSSSTNQEGLVEAYTAEMAPRY